MTKQIQFRRGSSAEHQAFTGASGEITVDTNLDVAVVHDGSTPGGQYLIGETSPQGLTNKRWVGIGTTTTGSLQFVAIGDANIDGNLQLRSLDINFRAPVTLSGIRSDTSNNIITGINTSDIRVGYVVTSNVVSSGTTVISVGTNFIQLSDYTPETQIQKIGTLNNTDGNVLGIDTSNIAVGYAISNYSILLSGALVTEVGVGSITVSETVIGPQGSTEPFYFSNLSISTSLTFNDPLTGILNVGIITAGYVTLEDLTVNGPAYITGLSTFSDRVIFDSTNSIQIPSGTTEERDVVGVAVTGQIRFNTDNSSFEGYGPGGEWGSLGGVKDVDGDTYIIPESSPGSDEDTLYIYAGGAVAGTISSTIGTILNVDLQVSGITTISGFLDVQEYANIGQNISVGTTVQTDDIVATGDVYVGADIFTYGINAEIGITTYLNSTDFEVTRESVGLSTIVDAFITNSYSENGYINVGIVTTISGTSLDYNISNITTGNIVTGVVTTLSGTNLNYATSRSGNSYINVGFVTTLYVNTGVVTSISGSDLTYTNATINNVYADVGIVTTISGTDLNYSGIGTITNLEVTTGTVTNLTSTDSTITTADIDTAYVNTGVVTTISGTDLTYTTANIDTAYVNTGVVTTISGTDLNYSGISTLNKVGVTTLTFDAYNDILSQDSSVTIKTSTAGISSHYTLTLPATVGTAGQVLGILPGGNGELGFTTAGLYESRYYVSALNGNDSYDGKTLPVKTIKKAAQLASFNSFVIPGQRYLDAGNLLESNKEFIQEEVVAYLEFNYENITTDLPDYDATICKRDVGYLVDALVYDIRFGGNSKSIEAGNAYWDGASSYVAGEEEQAIFAYEYLKFIGQYVINNQTPPTIYQTSVSQSFDFTITQDPNNTNDFDFHVSKDARNLILANKLEIVDKSLAAIAIDHPDFYFPGDTQSNERSRFYDSYRLIQQNKQEIIDYAWADTVATYPGVSSTEDKCKRDLGYFIDAVSTDVFTGGNNYTRSFLGFYFDGGAPLGNGLVGEEIESNHAFTEAAVGMSSALTNQLTIQDLTITADPITGSNTDPLSCANVRSTVSTLTGIVTTAVAAGSTAGIGTTSNYGYFLITPDLNVSDSVGIGSTNIFGGRKCARDLNYIVDALAQDVSFDTNQHILYATKKYFDGAGTLISNGIAGETSESITAFNATRDLAKKAITNQLNNRDLTVIADSITGFNTDPYSCSSTQTQIGNLVGILTTALDTASLVGIASTSIGQTDCADVRSALVNYVGIITTIVGLGTTAAPATVLPETQSKPIAIFVEAGEYLEDNPIILYDDIAVLGDNLRNTIIRPQNANKDLFRLRNGVYLTGFAMKDAIDAAGVPQYTFNYAVAFDDPADTTTSRIGYATKNDPPVIFRSPYIQNCSILSFLGGNGILVDGSKVQSPNVALVPQESERPVVGDQPQQGKSMVAAAFTMVSFGGIGWRTINDGYAQVVSCFQIFCKYGSLTQSGGYLSITNSATNFGLYALRSTGFSKNSFAFDRGRIAATGTSGGSQTLKVVGLGRSEQDLYVCRFINNSGNDQTALFKPVPVTQTFTGTASTVGGSVGIASDKLFITGHPFLNGDSVVYYGDVQDVPERVIGGLIHENQYYVVYIDANTIQLTEDSSLTQIVDLTGASTGIHTFIKNTQEFFASEIVDRHNSYQKITIPGTQTLEFVSGRQVQQTVTTGTAVGYAYTWDSSSRELIVSVELSNDERVNFAVTDGVTNLLIEDHTGTPIGTSIGAVTGLTTYWSVNAKIASTLAGGTIITPSNLPEDYKLHFHRPSVINSSSHTWEYSGSGTDYNALPENGGRTDPATEQVSEGGGRVYSSGTNELGDFKIGDFITAYNRTGNIIFNNTVTIGNLDSLRLSLSGGVSIEEFSIDGGMGDNETGGPQNSRVSTQLAVRTFLSNRLGNFIDKLVSTNSIPNAVVQLNSLGQINADLIPPKSVNYYKANYEGARTQLVNQIPAQNILSGEVVSEPVDSFVLLSDLLSQYIVLDNDTIYNFNNQDEIVSVNAGGGAIGVVTAPTTSGVNTDTLSFPNVGYGTTGLVRGVSLSLKDLVGGSGYTSAGIYTGVRLDIASGIGTGITGTITVGVSGTVTNVAITTGGFKFEVDDLLTVNDPNEIGGRSGGSNFTIKIGSVETRLYIGLTNAQKFAGTIALPDYFADGNAVGYSTNIGIGTTVGFTPTDIDLSGSIDFANDRIVLGSGHPFADGDAVVYTVTAGTAVSPLTNGVTYYTKTVGISSVELYTTYALVTKLDLQSSGTGTHELVRAGFNTVTDQITFVGHPFTQGDPVRVTGSTPTGITTGNFYFVGSVTTNTFTLHETRAQSLSSINGLLLNTQSLENASGSVGIMTLTEQNVEYTTTVNTSSSDVDNWSLLSSSSLDAANIVSGIFDPVRLGTGVANEQTFLAGDSSYKKVITSVGIGTTAGFDVQGYTSVDFPPGGVGITTYYGDFVLGLNRVESTIDDYSTLGISQYKLTTFAVGEDGRITIKNSASGGDVDAASLGGNSGAYYIDSANHIGVIPITRGGTGLNALPSSGAILQGNGSSYNLTTTPTFVGDVSFNAGAGAITVGTDSDIRFTNGSNWTGEHDSKIQFFNNKLYLQYTTALILRNSAGSDRVTFDSLGNVDVVGIITASRFISDVAQGTAPFVVASTTQVTNLNANYLNGYASATTNTANRVVRRDASGNFAAGTITATLSGTATNATNTTITNDVATNAVHYPTFVSANTGNLGQKVSSTKLTYNPSTGRLTATTLAGSLLNTLTLDTSGTGLSGSTSFNNSGNVTFTVTSNATSANTGGAIVARDGSGNFSAGTITASTYSGNLQYALTRGTYLTGNNFDNSANTTWAVDATSANTASKVVARDGSGNFAGNTISATTFSGNLQYTLTRGSYLTGNNFNNSASTTWAVDATSANTGSKVVARDSSGNFAAGAVTVNSLFSGTVDLTSELNFTSPAAKYIDFYTKNSGGTAYSANLRLVNHDSSSFHTAIKMIRDGSVELYYNNSKKLETSNTGVTVSNTVTATTFTSTQATGTAPFTVASTTKVDNLNADLFDGQDSSYYLDASNFTSIPDGTLTLQTSGTGLSGSTTFSANQETNATFTVVSNATSANTGGTIVARDGSGNFSAGTITATTFSGSGISLTNIPNSATTATTTNTGSTIVSRDSSGNFSAGTITATLSGNATSSTTATNANNINVADESTDTTCFPLFVTAATGNLPPKSGSNLTFNSSTGVLAATTFSGSGASLTNIPNGALTNSTISGVALGSNLNTLTLNTSGTGLSGSATYNGSGTATFTVTSNATSANTASTIVARNSSGNFSAGTITATLSGTATQVSNTLTRGTYLTGSNFDGSSATTWAVDATSANTASKVVARDGSGNFSANTVTLAGELRGPASFVIDPAAVGDNTGTVVIKGNLQIDGTQTTINSTTITIDDLNLTLASGAANAAAANGAGLTIDGASATITYSSTGDSWILNKVPYYNSNRILTTADEGSGNGLDADTLDGLQSTAFAQLSGATFTGNIAFSGSQTVDGRDLSVDGAKLDGIESGATGDQTASEILTLIKTVDGASSGLDADLLDGQQGSYYLNTSTTFGGDVSGTYNAIVVANDSHTHDSRYYTETESNTRYFRRDSSNDVDVRLASGHGRGLRFWDSDSYKIWMSSATDGTWGGRLDSTSDYNMYFRMTGGTNRGFVFQNSTTEVFQIESTGQVRTASNNIYANGNLVWHQGNDGTGSGLDADTVDGYQFLSTQGISATGNFGQWFGHNTYTDFNASLSYWGWNYVQANTNAPNSTSSQWYRNRVSLGSDYGLNYSAGHYWLEMAYPRYTPTTAGHMWVRTCENGTVGGWTQVGSNIIGNSSATGTVTASSDIRLKTNIETISDALNKVLDLRGVEFDRPDLDGSPRHIGVIAQEVENVIPEVVFDGADGYKKVAYGNLTAVLIEAVKEQQKQIDELRNEIKKLKGE